MKKLFLTLIMAISFEVAIAQEILDPVLVLKGDNISTIAKRELWQSNGKVWEEIKKTNNLQSDVIYPGQVLLLPRVLMSPAKLALLQQSKQTVENSKLDSMITLLSQRQFGKQAVAAKNSLLVILLSVSLVVALVVIILLLKNQDKRQFELWQDMADTLGHLKKSANSFVESSNGLLKKVENAMSESQIVFATKLDLRIGELLDELTFSINKVFVDADKFLSVNRSLLAESVNTLSRVVERNKSLIPDVRVVKETSATLERQVSAMSDVIADNNQLVLHILEVMREARALLQLSQKPIQEPVETVTVQDPETTEATRLEVEQLKKKIVSLEDGKKLFLDEQNKKQLIINNLEEELKTSQKKEAPQKIVLPPTADATVSQPLSPDDDKKEIPEKPMNLLPTFFKNQRCKKSSKKHSPQSQLRQRKKVSV
ncbi:MAG: LysM peptidoglycan-binding domain-containing protein [bacterium]